MSRRRRRHAKSHLSNRAACDFLETLLTGGTRSEILDGVLGSGDLPGALRRLRGGLRSHLFTTTLDRWCLEGIVRRFDGLTRQDGFHVLLEWDGKTHRFVKEPIPVLLLDYIAGMDLSSRPPRAILAVLLDYYFLYVLALLVLRAWDEGDPNQNLDRVSGLIRALQGGAKGSGLRLVADAEALLWVAISHYEPDDQAYDRLLAKVRTLDTVHQVKLALLGAPILGNHLRWGFEAYYRRDLGLMRADNVADYPWLVFSLSVLLRAWVRLREAGTRVEEREHVAAALLNGLTADPRAFLETAPPSLAGHRGDLAGFRELFERWRRPLLDEFERCRPSEAAYSPLAFRFNFPHNVLMPIATLAMLHGTAPNLPLNALLAREPEGGSLSDSPEILARILMDFGGSSPETLGERQVVMIGYHPRAARESYTRTLEVLAPEPRESRPPPGVLSEADRRRAEDRRPDRPPRRRQEGRPPAGGEDAVVPST